jgi:4-hydroxybenzoate polyprenyltransferase
MITGYIQLCRVSNLPTVWTNVLAAGVLSGAEPSAAFAVPALSMSLFYAGGMCLNDVLDRDEDAVRRPSRPIPSGRVSPAGAVRLCLLLFLAALLTLLIAPFPRAVLPGLALLVLIAAYDLLHRMHPSAVLLMAGCRSLVFAVTAWSLQGRAGSLVLLAGAVQFLYTVAISITARCEKQGRPFSLPVIPFMIAGFSLIDGLFLALLVSPAWSLAGVAGALLTLSGQRFVRGD